MSEKKLFSDPRWNDTSFPVVIGHREITPEEKERARKTIEDVIMRKRAKKEQHEKK